MGNFKQPIIAAGFTAPFVQISPDPIIAQRDPAPNDEAFNGQIWVNTLTNTAYIAAGSDSLGTVWVVSGSSAFTGLNLTINPGPTVLNGDFTVNANTGDANAVDISTNGAVTERILITNVQGTATDAIAIDALSGGLDLISGSVGADSVLVSASDPAGGVTIDAGTGGITLSTTGAITLSPGTATVFDVAVGDLTLEAATGSVIVEAGEAVADAIQITAFDAAGGVVVTSGTGGIDLDTTGAISIDGAADSNVTVTGAFDLTVGTTLGTLNLLAGEAVAAAINIQATDAAGGVDIVAGTGNLDLATTGAFAVSSAADSNVTVVGAFNLLLESTAGKVIIDSGKAAADAVDITCAAGGIDIDGALQINLESTQAAATAISINASNAAGGVEVNAGTGGITLNTTGAIAFNPGTATIFDVATGNLTLEATTGSVIVEGGAASATAVHLDATLNAAGGVTIDAGTGGVDIDTTGAISFDSSAASNVTVTGAFDLTLSSTAGSVVISAGEAAADSIDLTSAAGGIDLDAALTIDIQSTQAAATAINLNSSNAAGGITLSSGTGGIIGSSTGAITLDATAASHFTVTGAFDLTNSTTLGRAVLTGGKAAVDAISINASDAAGGIDMNAGTGGIDIDTTGTLSIDSAGATNLTATGAFDLLVRSTGGAVQMLGGKAALDAVSLATTNAAGGLQAILGTGGFNATTTGALVLDAAANSHITTTGAFSMLLSSTGGVTTVASAKAADAGAVTISASAADGGITLDAGATPGVTISNGTQTAQILVGTGSPNTVVTASQGSIFLRTDGGAGSTFYYNTNGITAWTAV